MSRRFRVVDLFAGPGGLAEGFSSVLDESGERVFEIALSVEKEASAHRTLTLRAFTRQFPAGRLPKAYYAFAHGEIALDALKAAHPAGWSAAEQEALLLELGTEAGNAEMDRRMDDILAAGCGDDIVVIGGPPCQAYSLVGRSRNRGKSDYVAEEDDRHFLYREYIRILNRLSPAAFVMENVKGMLSSSVSGKRIFAQVRSDLEAAGSRGNGYRLIALSPSDREEAALGECYENRDFLICAEQHGVPQARHRVIIVGIRNDLFAQLAPGFLRTPLTSGKADRATVRDVLEGLPTLRSGLSRGDSKDAWFEQAVAGMERVEQATRNTDDDSPLGKTNRAAEAALSRFRGQNRIADRSDTTVAAPRSASEKLVDFLTDPALEHLTGHESRGHMPSDLARYFFCSAFSQANGRPPKASDFPEALAPNHKNWKSGKFADRFRVQCWDAPSTTVVSHISKDGHYFIHPDPTQCRSLTVREAARLQTFPDNYVFLGNRTQQFVQVGNAVPPYLAMQVGAVLRGLLDQAPVTSRAGIGQSVEV
ncbi:DNA cytosine methyltransferase [uncultured Maricaulis sp.]|uniref:DNA cytosine methyltransferase n=1 Tax=uncultured Maricaulis sp. TaxID=174710 RepID=UPI00260BCA47|nr:DNA cytosine methyltransferase [uncultured Maricaulis sp.]